MLPRRSILAAVLAGYVAAAGAGCGGAGTPRPVPPPDYRPVTAADLRGDWRATDLDGWTYDLTIRADSYAQTITRTSGGPCKQVGTLQPFEVAYGTPYVAPGSDQDAAGGAGYGGATYGAAGAAAAKDPVYALVLTLTENTCNPDYTGAQLIVIAHEFDGDHVTLRSGVGYGGGPQETFRYERVARYDRTVPTVPVTP